MRYLNGTRRYEITYTKDQDDNLSYYSDSDYAADPVTRRSVSGTVVIGNGGAIYWQSIRQKSVSLSSAEAELQALALTTQTAVLFDRLQNELGYSSTPQVFSDNQATIKLISDNQYHKRTKHIDVKFFFVRELVEDGKLKVGFVPSEENRADICTKPFAKPTFQKLRTMVGVQEIPRSKENIPNSNSNSLKFQAS